MKKLKALVQIVFAPFIWIWKQILRLLKFLISKLFLRLVGGALIGSSIYFSESLDKEEHGNLIIALAIFGAVLFLFFDPIADEIDRLKERYQRKILIKSQLKPLSVFLKAHLNIIIDRKGLVGVVESSGIDYNKRDLVYIMIINDLPDLSQNQKDAILLTSLCHEIDDEADILKAEQYKLTIAAILERYNFLDPDDEAKLILKYYNNYQNNKSLATNISGIDYESETDNLTNKYNKTYNLSLKMKLEKDQAEEFRRTLSILIREGKLNVKQVEKDLKKRINVELKSRASSSKAFLVLANKFHKIEGVKTALNRFPCVVYPYKQPHNLPDSIKYLHTRIIFPPPGFQSAEYFLREEIQPHISEHQLGDGFIAIIPIEGTELYSIPEKADEMSKDHLKQGFESITAYKTGISLDMTELYMEGIQDEVHLDEILSNIPINIFVPNLTEGRKNFIISNYDDLKSRFNITRLGDWANINATDLKSYFIQLDIARAKQRLYTDANWDKVAKQIVASAIKHRTALSS